MLADGPHVFHGFFNVEVDRCIGKNNIVPCAVRLKGDGGKGAEFNGAVNELIVVAGFIKSPAEALRPFCPL